MSGVVLVCYALLMHYGLRLFYKASSLFGPHGTCLVVTLGTFPTLVYLSGSLKLLSVLGSLMPMALVIGRFLLFSGSPSLKL